MATPFFHMILRDAPPGMVPCGASFHTGFAAKAAKRWGVCLFLVRFLILLLIGLLVLLLVLLLILLLIGLLILVFHNYSNS